MYSVDRNFPFQLKNDLVKLHDDIRKVSKDSGSGVYATRCGYHGKIYRYNSDKHCQIWIGSSNFSSPGLKRELEACIRVSDIADVVSLDNYLNELVAQSVTIDKVVSAPAPAVTIRKLKFLASLPSTLSLDGKMKLPLRVKEQPKSGLNLFNGKGRFDKNSGTYTMRPWFEVEISSDSKTRQDPLYPKTNNAEGQKKNAPQKTFNKCEFKALLFYNRQYAECRMSTYSDRFKAMGSDPRNILGEFIKGQMIKAGVLKKGETITEDILDAYGRKDVTLERYTDSAINPDPKDPLATKVFVLRFDSTSPTNSVPGTVDGEGEG